MPKANRVHSTPRKTAPKIQPVPAKKSKEKGAARSEIIEQCVIYAQSIAAFQAGFKVDGSSDFDYAGSGKGQRGRRPARQAEHALLRLVALSSANYAEKPIPSREEMLAKAGVLSIIGMETDGFKHPEKMEGVYVRFFAQELEAHFKKAIEDEWTRAHASSG